MAEKKLNLEKLNIGGEEFDMSPWGLLGLTKPYFATLLSRDEYCPVADKQPTEKDVIYTDPASGNPAGFHAGQCVTYPDKDVPDGWGLSIAKKVDTDAQGIPTKVYWLHITDILKALDTDSGLQAPPSDGNTYAYCDGNWVEICPPGMLIQVQKEVSAQTLESKSGTKVEVSDLMKGLIQSRSEKADEIESKESLEEKGDYHEKVD